MKRSDWLVPLALFVFAALPLIPGAFRVLQLAGGPALMAPEKRFDDMPLPVLIHIISASLYYLVGPLQFSAGIRRNWPKFHRWLGRSLVPAALGVALSGLWMTLFYARAPMDGEMLFATRLVVGTAMLASILLGLAAILRRDVPTHRAWMIRAYALGLGAGTQLLIFVPLLPFGPPDLLTRELLMGAAWLINLAFAEWIIRRKRAPMRRVVMAA
ncbi:MAG: DUF2306 domain-containing protein [Devosia sp.]